MIKVELQPESRRIVYWDSVDAGLKAVVSDRGDRWGIEIECDVISSPGTVENAYIPVLQEAIKMTRALNG